MFSCFNCFDLNQGGSYQSSQTEVSYLTSITSQWLLIDWIFKSNTVHLGTRTYQLHQGDARVAEPFVKGTWSEIGQCVNHVQRCPADKELEHDHQQHLEDPSFGLETMLSVATSQTWLSHLPGGVGPSVSRVNSQICCGRRRGRWRRHGRCSGCCFLMILASAVAAQRHCLPSTWNARWTSVPGTLKAHSWMLHLQARMPVVSQLTNRKLQGCVQKLKLLGELERSN